MVSEGSEQFTRFEIYRPVEDGLYKFMAKVRYHGHHIFAQHIADIIESEYDTPGDGTDENIGAQVGIGHPRLQVYDLPLMKLMMFEQRARADMKMEDTYRIAKKKLEANADPYAQPKSTRIADQVDRSLGATLMRRGLPYDVVDQSIVPTLFNNVISPSDAFRGEGQGRELSLIPEIENPITCMLLDQAELCVKALEWHATSRESKRKMSFYHRSFLHLPFVRMPEDVTLSERQEFMGAINDLLPIRVALGGLRVRVTDAG